MIKHNFVRRRSYKVSIHRSDTSDFEMSLPLRLRFLVRVWGPYRAAVDHHLGVVGETQAGDLDELSACCHVVHERCVTLQLYV